MTLFGKQSKKTKTKQSKLGPEWWVKVWSLCLPISRASLAKCCSHPQRLFARGRPRNSSQKQQIWAHVKYIPSCAAEVLNSALFIVTLRPLLEVTTSVLTLWCYTQEAHVLGWHDLTCLPAATSQQESCRFDSHSSLSCACLPGKDKQWFVLLQSAIEAVVENKRMSFSIEQLHLWEWHDQQIEECVPLGCCLPVYSHRASLRRRPRVPPHTSRLFMHSGQLAEDVQWRACLPFCAGCPVKTALGSSKCSPLSWPGQHGNCVRNYGN